MAGFVITDFSGMIPRASARLLAQRNAQTALNSKLWSGELRPFNDALFVVTPSKVGTKKTIYRFGEDIADESLYWWHWLVDVDAVRGPIDGDVTERTYWTGETEPRVSDNTIALTGGTDYPMAWYKLGIPIPAAAPGISTAGGGAGDAKDVAAIYTYVSAWGEEGIPSDASPILAIQSGDQVTVNGMSTGPGAGYNIATKRIYIVNSGNKSAAPQLWAEVPVAQVSYTAALTLSQLGAVCKSRTWAEPPAALAGLRDIGNGMLAGFETTNVWMCEPFQPHAWPYKKAVPYTIVGLGGFDSTVVALTKGSVYAGVATAPGALTLPRVTNGRPCVAKRGIVDFAGHVLYPCPDGLGMVSAAGWSLVTDPLFTKDEWQLLNPSSISAYRWGNRYVGFYDTGTGTQQGFIFDPTNVGAGLVYTSLYATAGYNDPQRDSLYLQIGNDIKRFDGGTTLGYTWRSKVFTMPRPINPAAAQVIATTYPVTLKLYADGVLKATKSVADEKPFALPSGYKARDFEVQLEGGVNVRGVAVAESVRELRQLLT